MKVYVVLLFAIALSSSEKTENQVTKSLVESYIQVVETKPGIPKDSIFKPLNTSFHFLGRSTVGTDRAHITFSLSEENIFKSFTLFSSRVNTTLAEVVKARIDEVDGSVRAIERRLANVRAKVVMASSLLGVDRDNGETRQYERSTQSAFDKSIFQEVIDFYTTFGVPSNLSNTDFARAAGQNYTAELEKKVRSDASSAAPEVGQPKESDFRKKRDIFEPLPESTTESTIDANPPIEDEDLTTVPPSSSTLKNIKVAQIPMLPLRRKTCVVRPESSTCEFSEIEMYNNFQFTRVYSRNGTTWVKDELDDNEKISQPDRFFRLRHFLDESKKVDFKTINASNVDKFMELFSYGTRREKFIILQTIKMGLNQDAIASVDRILMWYKVAKNIANDRGSSELLRTVSDVDHIINVFSTLKQQLSLGIYKPLDRTKRQLGAVILGLTSVLGIGSSIYSTVQVNYLHSQMNLLDQNQNLIMHQVTRTNTAVNNLYLRLGSLVNVTAGLTEVLKSQSKTLKVKSMLQDVESILYMLESDVDVLLSCVEAALKSEFSPFFIEPLHLDIVFDEIRETILSHGYDLIEPVKSSLFYSPTSFIVKEGVLYLFSHLDIKSKETLDVFRYLASYVEVSEGEVIKLLPRNQDETIIATNGQKGILMTEAQLSACRYVKGIYVCQNHPVLRSDLKHNSCLGKLQSAQFKMVDIREYCTVHLLSSEAEEAQLLGQDRLFYHTATERSLSITCFRSPPIIQKLKAGSYVVRVPPGCELATDTLSYRAHKHLELSVPMVAEIDSLDHFLKLSFVDLKDTLGSYAAVLKELARESSTPLSTVINLKKLEKYSSWVKWFIVLGSIVSLLILMAILYCAVKCGLFNKCRGYEIVKKGSRETGEEGVVYRPQRPSAPKDNIEMKQLGKGGTNENPFNEEPFTFQE